MKFTDASEQLFLYYYPPINDIERGSRSQEEHSDLPEAFVRSTLEGKEDFLKGEYFSRDEVFGRVPNQDRQ